MTIFVFTYDKNTDYYPPPPSPSPPSVGGGKKLCDHIIMDFITSEDTINPIRFIETDLGYMGLQGATILRDTTKQNMR